MKPIKVNGKVLLNRIQYDSRIDFALARAYFLKHGVDIAFITQKTDVTGYSSSLHSNTTNGFTQYVLDGAKPLIEKFVTTSDDMVIFVIQASKEFGVKCPSTSGQGYMSNNKTLFINLNADDQFSDQPGVFLTWLLHEIMHALVMMARRDGFAVVDCMDILIAPNGIKLYYYLNDQPDNVNSNFINQWELLYPWLNSKHVFNN